MTLLDPQDWTFPVPIAYGPGRLAEIGALCRAAGMRYPLIATDRGSRDLPFIAALQGHLTGAGLGSGLFAEISPNPRDTEIGLGAAAFRDGGHDGVIGIGGGSAMDGAKAIALTALSDTALWDFEFERPTPDLAPNRFPPLICIPTTAGTGAETESTAMVTDTDQGMKFCVWHPRLKPAHAVLDPELTLGLPRDLTAWTGIDALTHAVEAYCVPGFHPLCDGAALEGLRLVARWLPVAVDQPNSLEARGGMLTGSCLAGVAFLKGLGIVHAISHMVGAEFETHHGLTNAVLLPVALRFNASATTDQVRPLAEAMDLRDHSAEGLHTAICDLLDRFEIPRSLGEIGVPGDCAPRIAAKAMHDSAAGTNPRQATLAEMEALIAEGIAAAR
ncbi:MAG: iron-containing alcohol dehydrogenase [Pseudomonadota bacterium]